METLFTPWRYSYISRKQAPGGCFLCEAAALPDAEDSLVVERTRHFVVLLNRHPYSNGHVMVAPREHVASPNESGDEARAEFWPLVLRAQGALAAIYRCPGFNLGMNVGSAAGAGVPDHYHFHIVPRWNADTNFMAVVGGVRVVPEDLQTVREKLRRRLAGEGGS